MRPKLTTRDIVANSVRPVKPDPFKQLKDKNLILRLLSGSNRPLKDDMVKYYKTDWFISLKSFCIWTYKTCCLCDKSQNLTIHHKHYKSLFQESHITDVSVICNRCHGSYHRGRKR